MSLLLELPTELLQEVLNNLTRLDIVQLSKCNRVFRLGFQPFVMPTLTIEVDFNSSRNESFINPSNSVLFAHPVIHKRNINEVCIAAANQLIQYYLSSVTELVIHEPHAKKHKFDKTPDLAEHEIDYLRNCTSQTAFNHFSPYFLVPCLTNLVKVTVKGGYRCLASSYGGFNTSMYWQCFANLATNAKVRVYINPDCNDKHVDIDSEEVLKCVAGLCVSWNSGSHCRPQLARAQQVESLHVERSIAPDDGQLVVYPKVTSLFISECNLPDNLDIRLPSLVTLTVERNAYQEPNRYFPKDRIELAPHPNVKELIYLHQHSDPFYDLACFMDTLRMLRFPSLASMTLKRITGKNNRHLGRRRRRNNSQYLHVALPIWREIGPLFLETLSQSTHVTEITVEGRLSGRTAAEFFKQKYAFGHSLRVFNVGSIGSSFCQSSLHWPELRVIYIQQFVRSWTIEQGQQLFDKFPQLQRVVMPQDVSKTHEMFLTRRKVQELERAVTVLSEPAEKSTAEIQCSQLVLNWAIGSFGRQHLVDNQILPLAPLASKVNGESG